MAGHEKQTDTLEKKYANTQNRLKKELPDLQKEAYEGALQALEEEAKRYRILIAEIEEEKQELQEKNKILLEQNQELQTANEQNQVLAETDSRTGLLNKYGFERRVRPIFDTFSRPNEMQENRATFAAPFNILLIDIDNFKDFNSKYGLLGGDEVIKGIAQVLQKELRPGDLLCRWGGEEFVVAFMGKEESREKGFDVAERLRLAVQNAVFDYQNNELQVTVSVGAGVVIKGETYEELFARANLSLTHAKGLGKNRTVDLEHEPMISLDRSELP